MLIICDIFCFSISATKNLAVFFFLLNFSFLQVVFHHLDVFIYIYIYQPRSLSLSLFLFIFYFLLALHWFFISKMRLPLLLWTGTNLMQAYINLNCLYFECFIILLDVIRLKSICFIIFLDHLNTLKLS